MMTDRQSYGSLLKTALGLVVAGARIADANSGARAVAHKESVRDIVTSADLAIDSMIRKGLAITKIPVLSEEHTYSAELLEESRFWVLDPIDGTVNFAHQIPFFSVSLGLVDKAEFSLGIVCAPALDELYLTLEPGKALLNGQTFKHAHQRKADSLFAASFHAGSTDSEYELFKNLNSKTRGCLRTGSASMNICWTALGKLQCTYGFRAKLWDVAAGLAIAKAAGCELLIRNYPGEPYLDYAAGSKEAIELFMRESSALELW